MGLVSEAVLPRNFRALDLFLHCLHRAVYLY
jgi:hypothetical protein